MTSPGRLFVLVLLVLIGVAIGVQMPELRRYMKVRSM
jgi:hypothetical protein